MNKIETKVIVFDQGYTLLMNPFEAIMKLKGAKFLGSLGEYGYEGGEEWLNEWRESNNNIHYPFCGHFTQEELIVQDFLKRLGISEGREILSLKLLKEYREGLGDVIRSDPRTTEVRGTLEILKNNNKRLGVFSNDRQVGLEAVLNYMNIKHLFEYIETSESIGIEKPDPNVYNHILNHFGLPPHLVTYVGDDPKRDIVPAKVMGLKTVLYLIEGVESTSWRESGDKIKEGYSPDAIIKGFKELVDIII